MSTSIVDFNLEPGKFYALIKLMNRLRAQDDAALKDSIAVFEKFIESIDENKAILVKANNSFMQEIRASSRRNHFDSIEEQSAGMMKFIHTLSGQSFLSIATELVQLYSGAMHTMLGILHDLKPNAVLVANEDFTVDNLDFNKLQQITFETQLNQTSISKFISAIVALDESKYRIVGLGNMIINLLDNYYRKLLNRHSVQGIKIHGNPILTDISMSVFENIDAHGEIEDGKKPDELSAYSMTKAEIMVEALGAPMLQEFISDPNAFILFIKNNLEGAWKKIDSITATYKETINEVMQLLDVRSSSRLIKNATMDELDSIMIQIATLNPNAVREKENSRMLSAEERFDLKFRNKTLRDLSDMLTYKDSMGEIIKYVLERKAELRRYYRDENSFYVCKIGARNDFIGKAPGELQVIPGVRPLATLDEISGSGFDDIKNFVSHIEYAAQWHDIFLATSPSKTADKSNVLLIGPQGSGKTEVLRAVGSDKNSVGIFAQGSDFLTCWMGEAEKNPKRLFEAAIKIQKESNKHVHILIDEIDSVMHKPEGRSNEINLTLEFQMLMDGVVHYPNLSIWGTTNNPERIPMPMLRRFSLVKIVGELTQQDRSKLLKQFMNYIPLSGFTEESWDSVSAKLEGATGDIIRKICDDVWRKYTSHLVKEHPAKAKELNEWLNQDGVKFDINSFDSDQRSEFKSRLKHIKTVEPGDLHSSALSLLNNIAIRSEIETAVATYDAAKRLLLDL